MLKKILAVSVIASGLTSQALAAEPYIEGQLGFVDVSDVETNQFSGTAGGFTFTNFKSKFEYDNSLAFGVEAGLKGISATNWRVGLAYTRFKAEASSATLSGSATNGTTTWTGPTTTTDPTLLKNFDNNISLFTANAYYDFMSKSRLTPYVGIGAGFADIENAKSVEAALALSAGVNFDLTEKTYFGLKGNYYRVSGPDDSVGLEYDTIKAYSWMATVGYRF
ncbi:MAG: porin family protein [Methylocystaceae bacterium]|nr:porin family protein [Methylocystaceae bacterium]